MTVIIDASALSAYLLNEEGREPGSKIRQLLIDGVVATELVFTESSNAILTALRRRRIDEEEARNAMEVLVSLYDTNVKVVKQETSLLREAFDEAKKEEKSAIAVYDFIYLVLAKRLHGQLASRDPKQMEIAKKLGIKIVAL